jgi:hypothetical protein
MAINYRCGSVNMNRLLRDPDAFPAAQSYYRRQDLNLESSCVTIDCVLFNESELRQR